MFRQGAEAVEAVLLSVERASPKGLALFLFGAATGPNCAQNNNPGGGPLRGPPPPPLPPCPGHHRTPPAHDNAPWRFPVRALPRSALCSRSLEMYTHPLTPALLLGPRRSGPFRGTPRRSPRPLARAGLRIVPSTGPLFAFWLGLLPSQCLGYRLARAGEARCTARPKCKGKINAAAL